jgi:hypothetical protein
MSNDYAFANGMRPPFFTTAGDDIALAAPSDDGPRSDWNEWMQWDPASTYAVDMKPLNVQGPVCVLRPDPKAPPFNRRQQSYIHEPSLGLQPAAMSTSAPLSAPVHTTAFTFGGNMEQPPAFDFGTNTLSSPSTGDRQHQNGYYSPPPWGQAQPGGGAPFSTPIFKQPRTSTAQALPISTPSLQHSPNSLNNGQSSSSAQSSPEPSAIDSRKRKLASEESDITPTSKQPVKKTAHNMIEKRYRTNLNDKIAALRDSVPSLRVMSRPNGAHEEDDDPEDLEGLTPAHKLNKATVLSKATEYICHLEKRNKRLQDEVLQLKSTLQSYEKSAISGPMTFHSSIGTPDGSRYHEDPFVHGPGMMNPPLSAPAQGLIQVPESIANLRRGLPSQQHYAPQPPGYQVYSNGGGHSSHPGHPLVNGRRSNGMTGKVVLGAIAGFMVLEGLVEQEQSQEDSAGRGLFALPINLAALFASKVSVGTSSVQLPLAKTLLVFGTVIYLVLSYFDSRSKPKKKVAPAFLLTHAPSLASPVEVRRQAWLTAIQTVWVPQHNFLLEVAALGLKTLKLSTRKIIGWHGYAFLTGITKDQEAARVKAWNIALDAQLTGGDAEISKSRLVLTLMASGTLPDTPARIMLKALHIRVLLWELANTGLAGWCVFNDLSAKIARSYWDTARSEHQIAKNLASRYGSDVEPLPPHLAALVEMECDDVLVPVIVQRAYNLAWNRPSPENTTMDESMDGVVEDFTICSPLDALAAWWSCYMLKKVLVGCLTSRTCTLTDSVEHDLGLAVHTAPPTSQAYLRALVAQAVVSDEKQKTYINQAAQAWPLSSPRLRDDNTSSSAPLINIVGNPPMAPDIQKAFTLAKCHIALESSSGQDRRQGVAVVNGHSFSEATTTLLGFVAGYRVLMRFMQDIALHADGGQGLEQLARSLRMWIGHESGKRTGLSNRIRARIIRKCLDASKTLVGLAESEEFDDGYVSSSIKGD